MNTKKASFLLIILFLFSRTISGQTNTPPASMPNKDNIVLIDKIIEVTKHENYFIEYCTNKVKEHAVKNNWSNEKTTDILKSINFKNYNFTIYNSYAFHTSKQLKSLLEALTFLNKDNKSSSTLILTNSMMQSNLELYISGVIESKYVTAK